MDVTVRSSRGLDLLRVCPLCRPSNRRSVPLPSPSGLGAECGDETRGVGTIWSVRQPCRGVSRLASTLGWPVRGVVQPLRWWLSGDTDAMWLDRCGEDDDRPFFHGLTEQLPVDVTIRPNRELDLLRDCPLCRPSIRRRVPRPPPSGLGAENGDETRGVGTILSVRQRCRGASRLASTLG